MITAIYAIVVQKKDNMLRQNVVDFTFTLEGLKSKYCHDNDCNAVWNIRNKKFFKIAWNLKEKVKLRYKMEAKNRK